MNVKLFVCQKNDIRYNWDEYAFFLKDYVPGRTGSVYVLKPSKQKTQVQIRVANFS